MSRRAHKAPHGVRAVVFIFAAGRVTKQGKRGEVDAHICLFSSGLRRRLQRGPDVQVRRGRSKNAYEKQQDRADRAVAQLDRAAGHEWRRRALALTSHRWSTVNPSGRRGMRCTRVKYRHSKQPYDNIIEVHLSQKKTDSKE